MADKRFGYTWRYDTDHGFWYSEEFTMNGGQFTVAGDNEEGWYVIEDGGVGDQIWEREVAGPIATLLLAQFAAAKWELEQELNYLLWEERNLPQMEDEEAEITREIEKFEAAGRPRYDSTFGDERVCWCGHIYYRHFDTYEQMLQVGCKYCYCAVFGEGLSRG